MSAITRVDCKLSQTREKCKRTLESHKHLSTGKSGDRDNAADV